MLTNFDLEDMAEDAGLDLVGVFSKDLLPKERVVGSYIINWNFTRNFINFIICNSILVILLRK